MIAYRLDKSIKLPVHPNLRQYTFVKKKTEENNEEKKKGEISFKA